MQSAFNITPPTRPKTSNLRHPIRVTQSECIPVSNGDPAARHSANTTFVGFRIRAHAWKHLSEPLPGAGVVKCLNVSNLLSRKATR